MVKLDSKQQEKEEIRRSMLAQLRSQGRGERSRQSQEIKRRVFKDSSFLSAKNIMFYISLDYEVDTWGIMEEALKLGKKVIVPVTDSRRKRLIPSEMTDPKNELQKGPFGIYEPKREYIKAVDTKDIDIVLVPGIAFDRKGNRIGHGGGYFDIFLRNLPKNIPTLGLAFKLQILKKINTLTWDVPVTRVITASIPCQQPSSFKKGCFLNRKEHEGDVIQHEFERGITYHDCDRRGIFCDRLSDE
jgi:5-formyltetrahydrofolate cyclo-ligase